MRKLVLSFLSMFLVAQIFAQTTARVQIIHNSPDAAASTVDIWLNNDPTPLFDNVNFREATPFIDVPAGVNFDITIQPSTSTDTTNGLFRQTFNLPANDTFIVIANGIISATGYNPAPAFGLDVFSTARETGSSMMNTDILVYHGSTDAPIVDVFEKTGPTNLVNDIAYSNFQGYLSLPTNDYEIQVRNQNNSAIVAAYEAPLSTLNLGGAAITVLASGFLDPSQNSNGPAFGLFAATAAGGPLVALPTDTIPTARVQAIHNSADAAAATVDVWLNDGRLADDFNFRTATPFVDAQAGVPFVISIAAPTSTDTVGAIAQYTYTLAEDSTYILVANGIVSGSGYSPATPFNIDVFASAREASSSMMNTDVLVYHGATDAPIVDVYEKTGPTNLVDDIAYSNFQGYLSLPTNDYEIQVRNQNNSAIVAAYEAPLSTLNLGGAAITVLASGFLDPSQNSNGPAFGLFAATAAGGPLVALPTDTIPTARVQAIHNSADAAAATVDVWLNDGRLADDFNFRTATPFVDAQAGVPFVISIAAPTSTDTVGAIAQYTYTLAEDSTYILVANGIVSGSGYSPATPFNIDVFASAREASSSMMNTDVLVYHGATDAPIVDVYEKTGPTNLVDDIAYSNFQGYLSLPTSDYEIQVRNQNNSAIVAAYEAPLSTLNLGGAAITVLASGFLDPSQNSNGPAFGLFAATAAGGALVALPTDTIPTARVQAIHNSADAAAATVDVWLNDGRLADDFNFRTATPFVDAQAGVPFVISIAAPTSTDTVGAIAQYTYTLAEDSTYILIANGIVSGSGYSPATQFNIDVFASAREAGSSMMNTDVLVYHGATDAPIVDVYEKTGPTNLVDDIAYSNFQGYLSLPTSDYEIQVRNQNNSAIVAAYEAPLSTLNLGGAAITVLASGFLDPSQNSNGPAFGLFAATAAGGALVALPTDTIPTARVQAIHNSADAGAATVDVWLNDGRLADDFNFRTATPFVDAQAGVPFVISIAAPTSTDTVGAIASYTYTLAEDSTYILIANGIVSGSGYSPATPFNIDVFGSAREASASSTNTDILVYHGATDAPAVDVAETSVPAGTVVSNLSYSNFDGYLSLATNDYVLDIIVNGTTTVVGSYNAPLNTLNLGGEAITVLASGFVDPTQNSNGPAFGLWAALAAGGNLVQLPVITSIVENALNLEKDVTIYPNPANNFINVEIDNDATFESLEIIDLNGRVVAQPQLSNTFSQRIDVSNLSKGTYIMKFTSDRAFALKKLIIE